MPKSPKLIGLFQALGLLAYIVLFTLIIRFGTVWLSGWEPSDPFISMTLFLIAFVTSALICSSLVFAYPIRLVITERKHEALQTVLWTLAWLIALGTGILAGLLVV